MNKSIIAAAISAVSCLVFAGTKTIDWVTLNGGSPESIFGEGSSFGVYEDGAAVYTGSRIETTLTVVDGDLKLLIRSSNNSGWHGACFNFTNECGVALCEAQQITVPYRYNNNGGANEVGHHFRLIIGVGNKYFGVLSEETVVKGEWSTLTFNFAEAFAAYPSVYAAIKDSPISIMRLYPYNTESGITTSATVSSKGAQRFSANDEVYVGTFTCSWTEVTGYTASFDSNGGAPVSDIETDTTGEFVFPAATREGFVFAGWYNDGYRFESGSNGLLTMDMEYVAAWKNANPASGLIPTSHPYRRELDIIAAAGSLCDSLYGSDIFYYPDTDTCKCIRPGGIYEVDAEPVTSGGATNVLLSGKLGTAGNNAPRLVLPIVGVTVSDVCKMNVRYRTTSNSLTNETMVLYYKAGNTWHHVDSAEAMQLSQNDELRVLHFNLADALGEAAYEQIKDSQIVTWHLYPYTLTVYGNDGGYRSNIPFGNGVSLELGRIELIGEHPDGICIIVK